MLIHTLQEHWLYKIALAKAVYLYSFFLLRTMVLNYLILNYNIYLIHLFFFSVMQHESTVLHLMQALCGCGGAPFTLLGLTPYFDPIITLLENSDPFSVADALFQLTTTLVENTSLPTFFLRHLMSYLSGMYAKSISLPTPPLFFM